jgi:hypothetical protein
MTAVGLRRQEVGLQVTIRAARGIGPGIATK